jgi:hypothetical protein
VLAEAIEEAYSDLFDLRKDAQTLDSRELRGKFRSLTQGQKSDNVINNMVATFSALCEQADWTKPRSAKPKSGGKASASKTEELGTTDVNTIAKDHAPGDGSEDRTRELQLHYNIQLILPPSRDPAVFDALFTSLKKHLL